MNRKSEITTITPVGRNWNPEWLHRAGQSISGVVEQWIVICDGANFYEVSKTVDNSQFKGTIGVMVLDIFTQNVFCDTVGQAQARNVALKFVTTEYVYALDADDFVDTESFARFAKRTMDSKFTWGACSHVEVDANEEPSFYPASIDEWDEQKVIPKAGFLEFYENNGFYPVKGNGGAIISTELAREFGGWDENLRDISEGDSLLAIISDYEEGYWNPENVLKKRKHDNSTSYMQSQQQEHVKRVHASVEQIFERVRPNNKRVMISENLN